VTAITLCWKLQSPLCEFRTGPVLSSVTGARTDHDADFEKLQLWLANLLPARCSTPKKRDFCIRQICNGHHRQRLNKLLASNMTLEAQVNVQVCRLPSGQCLRLSPCGIRGQRCNDRQRFCRRGECGSLSCADRTMFDARAANATPRWGTFAVESSSPASRPMLSNGKRIRRPEPYVCGKATPPQPGDEQCGAFSRDRLVAMDQRFLRAVERALDLVIVDDHFNPASPQPALHFRNIGGPLLLGDEKTPIVAARLQDRDVGSLRHILVDAT
jgi:hypothetical protein